MSLGTPDPKKLLIEAEKRRASIPTGERCKRCDGKGIINEACATDSTECEVCWVCGGDGLKK